MLLYFILIFFISLGFIAIVKVKAPKWGLIDIPNERSTHSIHIARGAGIGFFLAVLFVLPFYDIEVSLYYIYTYIAVLFVFLIGLIDDVNGSSPNIKFLIIILATILLSFNNIIITTLGNYFGFELSLGWFSLLFTIFAVVGFTNALNLIDGLDGLAASISIVILGTFYVVGYTHSDIFMMLISGAFIFTLLAFLVFNWNPASIFMGDSGSLVLGFVISILAIKSLSYIPTAAILFLAAIPILDTLVVMIRRKRSGRSMVSADKCHIHHILKHFLKENTKKTVIILSLVQLLYSAIGLWFCQDINEIYILTFFIFNILFLYITLKVMMKKLGISC